MHLPYRVAFCALLGASFSAHAAQPSRTPDPADPAAPVPAITYQSALDGYTPAAQDAPTPDKSWRAANASVAAQPGHAAQHGAPPEAQRDAAPARPAPAGPKHDHRQHH